MTINKAIETTDKLKPNTYEEEEKAKWLSDLDGQISLEVMYEDKPISYDYPKDGDRELIASAPYDQLYPLYLASMIDFNNRETNAYNNSSLLFQTAYDEFKKHYIKTHMPPSRENFKHVF